MKQEKALSHRETTTQLCTPTLLSSTISLEKYFVPKPADLYFVYVLPFWKSDIKNHTHHHLHSFPLSSPQTQRVKPRRYVWRKLQRSRWLACSLGAGSPSAHTEKNLWNLQKRRWVLRSARVLNCTHPVPIKSEACVLIPELRQTPRAEYP